MKANIIGRRKIWYIFSGTLLLISIISLFFWRLDLGLDFAGGTLFELKFDKSINVEDVRIDIKSQGIEGTIQSTGANQVLVRTKPISKDQKDAIEKQLADKFGQASEVRYETVGPTISRDLTQKAFLAVFFASLVIVFYVAFAFRKVSHRVSSWKFGISGIVALLHDALIVVGLFSVLGHFLNVEVDSLFVTAILTVISFSVHDTIVIFDRIRENLKKYNDQSLEEVTNRSVVEMMPRSINTSMVVFLVVLALYLFGGETTKYFSLALLVGIFFGTYSSIFIASPLVVTWQGWQDARAKKAKKE